jgi:mutator protein MutT
MYPSSIYRVVIKAFITNEDGEVFVVKESPGFWGLPGGGLEHGETPEVCLRREFKEELGIDDFTINQLATLKTIYLDRKDMWVTWIIYTATLDTSNFVFGDGITSTRFINTNELKKGDDIFEAAIFEVAEELR